MEGKKENNSSQQRRVVCYAPLKYHVLIKGLQAVKNVSASKSLDIIVRGYFENMNEKERERCFNEGMKATKSKHAY